jgi:hypothetical protein
LDFAGLAFFLPFNEACGLGGVFSIRKSTASRALSWGGMGMTSNPWDPAPYPEQGEADVDHLFIAIGRALTEWELFEEALSWTFAILVTGRPGTPSLPAIHAYGTIVAFRGRSEMVEAAARSYEAEHSSSTAIAPLFDLLADAGRFSGRRNEIAHGIAQPFFTREAMDRMEYDLEDKTEPDGFILLPSSYNTKKHGLAKSAEWEDAHVYRRPKYGYTATPIRRYTAEFGKLRRRTLDSWWAIQHEIWKARQPSSP